MTLEKFNIKIMDIWKNNIKKYIHIGFVAFNLKFIKDYNVIFVDFKSYTKSVNKSSKNFFLTELFIQNIIHQLQKN